MFPSLLLNGPWGSLPAESSLGRPQQPICDSFSIIAAKLFQLIEWVYKFLPSSEFGEMISIPGSTAKVMALYKDCLVWYDTLTLLLRQDDPVALFVQ